MNFETALQNYAELAVKVGVNLQKDQTLVINTTLDSVELVRLVTKEAYQLGAKNVVVNWTDDVVTRTKYELAPLSSFEEFPEFRAKEMEALAANGAAFMSIVSSSPDLLKGVDPEKISANQKSSGAALKAFRQYVQSDKVSWTVIAAPSETWALKVFPEERSTEAAVEKLWEAIFKAVRADVKDPVAAWKEHDETLHKKVDVLNEKRFKTLHYTASGTDLTIDLPETHLWVGAGSVNANGEEFMANMPTEEVFTVPHKEGVNGTVASTKPLSYGGNIIDNFSITFENGRIVKVEAEEGQEILQRLVDTDEGAKYLGEVALVPHQSPISDSGVLFYNTLFDENASNHLAIGNAYAFCIEGGKEMSEEELEKNGLNSSITHVDFMIGSAEMNIDGIKADGTKEAIFRNGNWAI
ncbi:aminopeptidase [Mangrovibacillus cuniculi]|uniref:Aminopeptidase n=1 Tax=Mangrovibacillus cuniculi TaxID=2593652 RepID=A0A7S8C9A3_9BACI|nr:aminopeptidase [Mangrovibacillus cuniculi]QPC45749.1 aminopeptidase [Mangrovibacillus cuniculi]